MARAAWPCVLSLSCVAATATPNPDASNWAMQNGNAHNHRYSPLRQINRHNVSRMNVAWVFPTGVKRGHQGSPLVVADTMYLHTPFPNKVFALDLNTRTLKWKYEPTQDLAAIPQTCCDTVSRGLAYSDGTLLLQQADSTLVAFDAASGAMRWSVKNGDPARGAVNTNAPHVFKDKVITGISGGDWGVRGYLSAYDIKTGKRLWRGYSTGPDDEMLIDPRSTTVWMDGKVQPVGKNSSLASWQGEQWKTGGATTWGWYSYDQDLNLLYYGTGNAGPWNPVQRPGDNRWSASIWARDLDTGTVRWVYQVTPHDQWNFSATGEMILTDLVIKGRKRKALVHFDSNGFAYTLDRRNGALLGAQKYELATNWASHVDLQSGRPIGGIRPGKAGNAAQTGAHRVCPASLGAKGQQPAAFNPGNGLFYVPTNRLCMDYFPFPVEYSAGKPFAGARMTLYPAPGGTHAGQIVVWDARIGKIVQSKPETLPVWSGPLVTAGSIVCYGTLDGYLKCLDADNVGRELFRFKTASAIIGNVFTYEHKGRQYIGVYSGMGGWAEIGLAASREGSGEADGADLHREPGASAEADGTLTVFSLPAGE